MNFGISPNLSESPQFGQITPNSGTKIYGGGVRFRRVTEPKLFGKFRRTNRISEHMYGALTVEKKLENKIHLGEDQPTSIGWN